MLKFSVPKALCWGGRVGSEWFHRSPWLIFSGDLLTWDLVLFAALIQRSKGVASSCWTRGLLISFRCLTELG